MKIVNGKIIKKYSKNAADIQLRKRLKKILKKSYKLKLKHLPDIIQQLGIEDETYEIKETGRGKLHFKIMVKTETKVMDVIFFNDKVGFPKGTCKVFRNEETTEETYTIKKVVKVKREE